LVHGTGACKGILVVVVVVVVVVVEVVIIVVIIIIIIIIIKIGFAELRTTSSRYFVTHTEQSDECSHKHYNCTMRYEFSTDSSKMRCTKQTR